MIAPEDHRPVVGVCYSCGLHTLRAIGICRQCCAASVAEWARIDRATMLREIDAKHGIITPEPTDPNCA